MQKDNWAETVLKFDRWWNRSKGTRLLVADVSVPPPHYAGLGEFADFRLNLKKHIDFFEKKTFHGESFPDIGAYLGPGSLCTFIGSQPVYSDDTIWFSAGCETLTQVMANCRDFLESPRESRWFRWTVESLEYYRDNSEGRFRPSMPDLQQNLDILSALMGPQRLLTELVDRPVKVRETLDLLHEVWKHSFDEVTRIIKDDSGYTAYTHYNLLGKGTTSVLQSDISCMLSEDMFREFELPYLRLQSEKLDNIVYHLDGPGAVRHLDSLLSIDGINAIQWVPGAGEPGNSHESYFPMYDKITASGKGIYVFLEPSEIEGFLERYHDRRVFVRTRAETGGHQRMLVNEYSN